MGISWKKCVFLMLLFALCSVDVKCSGLNVRFLGTGAADWKKPMEDGSFRRLSSILVDNAVLVDFTRSDMDMIPLGCRPHVVFYTHSHKDHFDPEAAMELGVDTVYCSSTWVERCRADFESASKEGALEIPVIIPVDVQQEVACNGVRFLALPANHYTGDIREQPLMYLLIKDGIRVLYATDSAGIPSNSAIGGRFGTDGLPAEDRIPLSGLIMEATVGLGRADDFRLFSHSSVETVLNIYRVLEKTGCIESDTTVYLTHLARTLHPSQSVLDSTLPAPLKAAYDGLEIVY